MGMLIKKVSNTVETIQFWFSIIIIAFLTGLIFLQVVLRYGFGIPIVWSHEVASGLLIWLTFMGAAVLTKRNNHLNVDILYNTFPDKVKKVLNKLFTLLILIFSIFLIYFSIKLFNQQYGQITGSLRLSKAYYFSAPIIVFSISVFIYSLDLLFTKQADLDEVDKEV